MTFTKALDSQRAVAVGVVMAVGLLSTMAQAEDRAYPGSSCQPIQADDDIVGIHVESVVPEVLDPVGTYGILCPVRHDESANFDISVVILIEDGSASASFACELRALSPTGATVDIDSDSTTAAFSGGTTLTTSLTSIPSDSHISLYCQLPGAGFGPAPFYGPVYSRLRGYFVSTN